ncbi:hypothetical protein ACI8AC_15215 [Geodermatophilus sp. SYSU D00758]
MAIDAEHATVDVVGIVSSVQDAYNRLGTTICIPGSPAIIRPWSCSAIKLRREQMPLCGLSGELSDVKEDHLLLMSLGGHPTDPKDSLVRKGRAESKEGRRAGIT